MEGNVASDRPRAPQRLFKYATAEVARIMVGTLTARWSSPLIFDDPRDARCDWRHFFHVDGELVEDALAIVRSLIESHSTLPTTMSPVLRTSLELGRSALPLTTIDEILVGVRSTLGPNLESTRRSLQADNERWLQLLEGTRIFCLSERHDSPTMWSNFGDNHHGAVLGFSVTGEGTIVTESEVRPVRYSSEPAVVGDRRVWLEHAMGIAPIEVADAVRHGRGRRLRVRVRQDDVLPPSRRTRIRRPPPPVRRGPPSRGRCTIPC